MTIDRGIPCLHCFVLFSRLGILREFWKLPNFSIWLFPCEGVQSRIGFDFDFKSPAGKSEIGQIVLFSSRSDSAVRMKFPSKFSSPKFEEKRRFKELNAFSLSHQFQVLIFKGDGLLFLSRMIFHCSLITVSLH